MQQADGGGDLLVPWERTVRVDVDRDELIDGHRAAQDERDQGDAEERGDQKKQSADDEQGEAHRNGPSKKARFYILFVRDLPGRGEGELLGAGTFIERAPNGGWS